MISSQRNAWGNVNKPYPRNGHRPNRHWDPRNRGLRRAKERFMDLPKIELERSLHKTGDILKMREEMKKKGIIPTVPQQEHPIFIACTNEAFDRYIPNEMEGAAAIFKAEVIHNHKLNYSTLNKKSQCSVEIIEIYCHVTHIWQKFRENNVFVEEVTKELI